jgi:hypothetical protein
MLSPYRRFVERLTEFREELLDGRRRVLDQIECAPPPVYVCVRGC